MREVHSNYDIDLFKSRLIRDAARSPHGRLSLEVCAVIAEHMRACTFLLIERVCLFQRRRGYVLRRIIVVPSGHGYKDGSNAAVFHNMVATLVREMGSTTKST